MKSANRIRNTKCLIAIVFIFLYLVIVAPYFFDNHAPMVSYAQSLKMNQDVKQKQKERFDLSVREDFFAGLLGDEERLERGMKFCEDVLAKNPKHADALVWHGGGLLTRAAKAYTKGDSALGDKLWNQGLKEMNDAVAFEPDNMAVKIGRSATLVGLAQSGWDSSDNESRKLLESALLDYEKVYAWQKPTFHTLDLHSRGELLFGLASGWSILGEQKKAREYLKLIVKYCVGSQYETEARKWLRNDLKSVVQHDCVGCHVSSSY